MSTKHRGSRYPAGRRQVRAHGAEQAPHAFGDGTVVGRTLDNLLASRAAEVVVVLGSRSHEMGEAIGKRDVTLVLNPNYAAV